jgi:hypothetical protein
MYVCTYVCMYVCMTRDLVPNDLSDEPSLRPDNGLTFEDFQ